MKILFIQYWGWTFGGGETYSFSLKKELIKRGHNVKIFSCNNNPNTEHFSDYEFKESNSRMLKSLFSLFNPRSYIKLKKVLKDFLPDIVHIQNIDAEVTASVLLCLKNIPTVFTLHGSNLQNPLGFNVALHKKNFCEIFYDKKCARCHGLWNYIHAKIRYYIFRIFLSKVDLFISPSNYFKSLYRNIINNIQLLHNGIVLFEQKPIKYWENILFVGRLDEFKGVHILLNALTKIRIKHPNIRLRIAGEGTYEKQLQCQTESLGINDIVQFVGYQTIDQVIKLYQETTLVVIPSIGPEAFGLVGLEAMSVGRPVIASNVGGIPEWLDDGKTGFLVNPGNSEEIAERVTKLLSDRNLLKQMGENARKKAEQFSIETHVLGLEKIYNDVIKKYRAGIIN